MTIVLVEEYYVRYENRAKMRELRLKRNEILKSIKALNSIKTYTQLYGGFDSFIEFLEFESLSGIDEFVKEAFSIEEFIKVAEEIRSLIEPNSLTRRIWRQAN